MPKFIHYPYIQTDIFFKYLMTYDDERAHHMLRTVISEVTSYTPKELTINNPDIIRSYHDEKEIILDIHVKTDDGRTIAIEMQMSAFSQTQRQRFEYYEAKLHSRQMISGRNYDEIKETHLIAFVNGLQDREHPIFKSEFQYYDQNHHSLNGKTFMHIIYMPYLGLEDVSNRHLNMTETIAYIFQAGEEDDILKLEGDDARMVKEAYVKFEDDEEVYQFCIETRKELDAWEKRQREKELREEGMALMQEKINKLFSYLIADQRFDDLSRSTSDPAYQEELFKEYHLE